MAYPLLNELARHADDGALSFYYFLAAKLSTPNTVGARLWQRELPAECAALALSDIPKMRQSVRVLVRSRAQMDGVLELGAADDENEIAQILAMRDSCRVALENLLARLAENWLKQRVLHELSVAGATQNFEAEVLRHVRSFAATLRECGLDAAHIASTPSENQSRSASTVLGDEEPDYEFYAREAATAQALARLHLENDDEDLRLAFSILQRAAERLAGNDYRVAGLFVDAAKSAGEQGVLRDIWVTVSPRRRNKDAIHYDFDVASDKAGESLRRSVELAREAALSFLRRRCNHDADYAIKIHLDSSPDSLPLGGDSLGLAVALALIARVTGQTIGVQEAGDVAVTGAIVSSDGTIGAVGGIEEKLRAAQREMDESTAIRATRLRRVVVPADNRDEVPAPLQNAVSFAADLESLLAAGVLFDPLRPYLQRLAGAQSFSSTQLDAAQELWNRHYKVALFKRFYDDEKPVAIEIARRLAAQRLEGGLNQKNVARIPIVLDMARDVATNASWLDIIAAAVRRAVGAEPDESLLRVTLHDCGFAFILTGLDGDAALPFLQPSGQLAELRARYPHNQIIPVCSAATWQRRAPEFGDEWKNTLALYEGRSTILDRHVEAVTRRWNERVLHLFNVESGAATFYLPQQTRALDDAGGQSTPLENLLDAAPRCHLLLGESGAGKTTALHRWFFHALEIGRFTTLYLPADAIKAAFATSASSDATMNFLAAICNHAPVPVAPEVLQSQLERMPLLLLLDDLDEVADAAILDQLLSLISFLDNHNPVVRVVIACNRSRTTDGVLQKLLNRRAPPFFESRELLPLDLPSAQEVWTQLIGVERAREVAEEIESQRRAVSVRAAPRDEHGREPVVGLRPADDDESFKDRVEVIAQLRALLQDRSVKLVCIIGRGGIGKTALLGKLCGEIERGALQLSGDAKNVIGADGILYASCRGDDAPSVERIFHDAARMLGSPQSDELLACWNNASCSLADKIRFLLGKLRAGYYLLVLDNLEDALAPDNTLRDEELRLFLDLCLSTPHALRVLTTSREQVEVNRNALRARRQVFLDALPETDAATLLRELDVDGDLGLRVASEEQLREAARRCYGVPRALEAVAGILSSDPTLTLPELLRDADLFNEQVVENLVAEHFRRVSDGQRRVLEALAVYNRPVSADAIAFLLQPFFPELDVPECLRVLVRNYFVAHHRGGSTYELHPLDSRHAYNCIPEHDEDNATPFNRRACRRRAVEWILSFADDCLEQARTPREAASLRALETELEILRRAMDWALESSECVLAARAALALSRFLEKRGDLREAAARLSAGLRVLQQLPIENRLLSCRFQMQQAGLHLDNFEWTPATACAQNALNYFESVEDRRGAGAAHNILGLAARGEKNYQRAREHFQKALIEFRAATYEIGIANTHNNIGLTADEAGESTLAARHLEEALRLRRKIEDRRGIAETAINLGAALQDRGETQAAQKYYEEALSFERELQNALGVARSLSNLGEIAQANGDLKRATQLFSTAQFLFGKLGSPFQEYTRAMLRGLDATVAFETLEAELADKSLDELIEWAQAEN